MADRHEAPIARDVATAWTLAVDAVTAEVARSLDANGLRFLLLKGPGTADLLYENPAERAYGDSDVLAHPTDAVGAECCLAQLGFERVFGGIDHDEMTSPPAASWVRGVHSVDLHVRIPGIGADPEDAFEAIAASAMELIVGGSAVPVPEARVRLLHVALHAWHHGPSQATPLDDLDRAVQRCAAEQWQAAADAARTLGCLDEFSTALHLVPGGQAILDGLGLEARPSHAWLLKTDGTPMAEGLGRLMAQPGLAPRLAMLRDEFFPTPEFMRWSSALARRSQRGLLAAYLARMLRMALRIAPAARAWMRVRKDHRWQ